MRIPDEVVDKIRQEANILDIVSQYVQLKKKGQNHFASCPFHEERTPSFSVREEKQLFHCFSCGRGGNVFSFLMEIEGLTFPEAVIKTAELANIPIDEQYLQVADDRKIQTDSPAGKSIQIHELAKDFYHHILMHTKAGEAALNYLLDRGVKKKTIEDYQLGYAPDQRILLKQFLSEKQINDTDLLKKTGLFSDSGKGELYDRFYDRILFPLKNPQGKTVGFSGRQLNDNEEMHSPKYLNSPETEIFNKSNLLFNIDKARAGIRKEKEVYLFEGFMDVISSRQAGIENAVAIMGTSLTMEHIQQLSKMTDHIILSFDGDRPGMEAIKRAADFIESETHFSLEIVQFPEKMDPDDFIHKNGSESYKEFLEQSRLTSLGFFMNYSRQGKNLRNDSQRLEFISAVLKEMTKVTSAVERELYFQQLSEEFSLPSETLKEQFDSLYLDFKRKQTTNQTEKKYREKPLTDAHPVKVRKQNEITPLTRAEQQLLNRLFHHEEARIHLKTHHSDFHFSIDDHQLIALLFEEYQESGIGDIQGFIEYLKDENLKEKVVEIEWKSYGEDYSNQELDDCVRMIQKEQIQCQLEEKKRELEKASKSGDKKLQETLLIQIVQLNQSLKNPNH